MRRLYRGAGARSFWVEVDRVSGERSDGTFKIVFVCGVRRSATPREAATTTSLSILFKAHQRQTIALAADDPREAYVPGLTFDAPTCDRVPARTSSLGRSSGMGMSLGWGEKGRIRFRGCDRKQRKLSAAGQSDGSIFRQSQCLLSPAAKTYCPDVTAASDPKQKSPNSRLSGEQTLDRHVSDIVIRTRQI